MTATLATILVIDDDSDTRELLRYALEEESFEIVLAATGREGLAAAQGTAVDVILLDAMLPDISGFQCCEMLHEQLQDACPPVLMITSLSDKDSVNRAFAVHATDFVTKPVNLTVLHHRIKRLLRERELFCRLASTNSKLQQMSHTDELTRLANRRYFMTMLKSEWQRLARTQQPLSLMICDLDAFKSFNDTYGHPAGDRCLRAFADILQDSVARAADIAARYGGEEFVVMLPNTSLEGMDIIDRRIRQKLQDYAIPHRSSPIARHLTYSAGGVTAVPVPTNTPEDLILDADGALYAAKARGRNCSVLKYCEFSPASPGD